MQLTVPPDLESLINKRLSGGGYASAEDVLRRALERETPKKILRMTGDSPCRLIWKKAIGRPSAES